jgi:hypothetical protein
VKARNDFSITVSQGRPKQEKEIKFMKNPNIVKIVTVTLMVAALMPIRANANSGDRYVSNDTERPSNGAIHDYATAMQPTFITFDVPGAGTGAFQGTLPQGINPDGSIVGFIRNAGVPSGFARRGFLRDKDGTTTVFDAPGAGTGGNEGTRAYGINPGGAITGWFVVSGGSLVVHAYVRAKDGTFTVFDAGIPVPYPQGTFPFSPSAINPEGAITGYYLDSSNVFHGFLRAEDGTITAFDVPGAGTGAFQGTISLSINPNGAITGAYIDSSDVNHGFVRAKDGTITPFDVLGAGTDPGQGTISFAIAPNGAITGNYIDSSDVFHGFVRAEDGTITPFDVLGAGTGAFQGTFPVSINPEGAITGNYVDSSDVNHGFVRAEDGTITPFDVLGAGTDPGQGTVPLAIAPNGAITGYYLDSSNVFHGFLRNP